MLIVKDVKELSPEMAGALAATSRREWLIAGQSLPPGSTCVKEVWIADVSNTTHMQPLFAFGLHTPIFSLPAELWALLTSTFLMRPSYQLAVARKAKEVFDSYPPFVVTFRPWQKRRQRFARVFGLRELERNALRVIYGR